MADDNKNTAAGSASGSGNKTVNPAANDAAKGMTTDDLVTPAEETKASRKKKDDEVVQEDPQPSQAEADAIKERQLSGGRRDGGLNYKTR